MEEHAIVNVIISNFKGVKRCPYCGIKPTAMRWEDGKISMWCRNIKCSEESRSVAVEYSPEETVLQGLTWKLIDKWNKYCKEVKKLVKSA